MAPRAPRGTGGIALRGPLISTIVTASTRLIERLTRVDADTLNYEFTVTDPETWVSPWTASVSLRLNSEPMFEYACHEGNYSMPVMLGGARVEEAAAGR